jgi:CDP-diacylglycerol---glycerol-3-phosphate 3-phosphatidyltransferase
MTLPNQLTILRIILTPVFFILFLMDDPVYKQISIIVFLIAALTDWYDGWLARKFNYITDWGKFWDPLADKILTSSAFLAFVFVGILELWMVLIILIRDFTITSLRAYADYKKQKFPTSRYAQWKTFLQMAFLYYLLFVYISIHTPFMMRGNEEFFYSLMNEKIIYSVMLFLTIITVHSGVTYILNNKILIKRLFPNET